MAKGDAFPSEATRTRDRASGRTVWRLTGRQATNRGPYFYNSAATQDGRRVIFGSDRSGGEQLYMVEWPTGSIIQLTNGRAIAPQSAVLAPRGAEVYFFDGPELHSVALGSFRERVLAAIPEGLVLAGPPAISSDGQLVTYCCLRPVDLGGATGPAAVEALFNARPHCEIWAAPIDSSGAKLLHAEDRWLGHPQFRPGDSRTVMYCHEGPWEKVERLWALVTDGSAAPRCIRPQAVGRECIGHEYFTKDGANLIYLHEDLSAPEGAVRHSVRALELATGLERVVYRGQRVSHFSSNAANTLIAADTSDPADPNLYLIEVATGKAELLCSCRTKSGIHPHPSFSHDGKFVFFNSDQDGWPNLYMAAL